MKTFKLFCLLMLTATTLSCSNDDDGSKTCDAKAILDPERFETAPAMPLNIESAVIEGDCLNIRFTSSGCNGDTWVFNLIGVPSDATVFPPLVNVRLSLSSTELCEAIVSREASFDLSVFQQSNADRLTLTLQNNGQSLLYVY
jgi:hypothetical protein